MGVYYISTLTSAKLNSSQLTHAGPRQMRQAEEELQCYHAKVQHRNAERAYP